MRVTPKEIYAENGDLEKIEFYGEDGKMEIQAVWDDTDPNDEEHRVKFREWSYRFIKQLNFEVDE